MKKIFARFGIPEEIKSDNGLQYTSSEFQQFSNEWKFNHTSSCSSPRYPRSNGLAERTVKNSKEAIGESSQKWTRSVFSTTRR